MAVILLDDITWFKPIELTTKCGHRGHIKEQLGMLEIPPMTVVYWSIAIIL